MNRYIGKYGRQDYDDTLAMNAEWPHHRPGLFERILISFRKVKWLR